MSRKYLPAFIVTAALITALFVFAGWKVKNQDFENSKTAVVIRKIGHEILLVSGDSHSRVLPVKQLSANEYQLQFESRFTFVPDSIIKTVQQLVSAYNLPQDYIVNVIECANKEVIFGYAVLGTEQSNIVPCVGRKQAESCYFINLTFQDTGNPNLQKIAPFAAVSLLAISLLFFGTGLLNKRKKETNDSCLDEKSPEESEIQIGQYLFNSNDQYLAIGGEKIELTMKENKLLSIFVSLPNQVIDRSRLQKEVWEDEGVIVGRSLDVFISKLRKKLEQDPAVKLVNVHGKGYKLEISGS